jgi:predicted ferric reductase
MYIKRTGIYAIYLILFITVALFVISKPYAGIIFETPYLSLGQLAALLGATLLSLTFCLTTNNSFLENTFGGLDKVYKVHQKLGKYGFVIIVLHPTFIFLDSMLSGISVSDYVSVLLTQPYLAGVLALTLLTLLIFITLFVKLSYETWRLTHRFMGVVLVLLVLHMLLIHSDISRFMPLRFWIFGWATLAMISVAYRYIFYDLIPRKLMFTVSSVEQFGNVWEIKLTTDRDRLIYRAGQFVFVKFNSKDLIKQNHPFSISSFTDGQHLRLSIKESGDFTTQLGKVKSGDKVEVYGPYGRFTVNEGQNKDIVLIAGGIGVTPILSIVQYLSKIKSLKNIYTIYSVAKKENLYRADELAAAKLDKYKYSQWVSEEKGALKVENITAEVGNLTNKQFYICGPLKMMNAISQQLLSSGVAHNDIFFEDFSLR